jgi:release factor glutamine methyltransferase
MSASSKKPIRKEANKKISISIRSSLAEGTQTLDRSGIGEARLEAGSLLAHVIGRDRAFIITHGDDVLAPGQLEAFRSLVARRAVREPLQYITGHQEFFELDFEVTPEVLIPRPETELVVEAALEILKEDAAPYFADIGTGSGCIAISLLHELPQARAVASDISPAALRVAQRNAERHGVSDRLRLIESDCFSAINATEAFALIASNPPYVSAEEMQTLPREVRREPTAALAGGTDGLSIIRRLLQEAPMFLRTGGHLVFEIGFGQSEMVKGLIDAGVWELIEIRKDLQGIPRAVVLRRN